MIISGFRSMVFLFTQPRVFLFTQPSAKLLTTLMVKVLDFYKALALTHMMMSYEPLALRRRKTRRKFTPIFR